MMNEGAVQQRLRLEAARLNTLMWRNNVGACEDKSGRVIRYGLANDSKALNGIFKSSDLIGITPIFITPDMVGEFVGVFTAIESKREGWHMTPSDDRAKAQLTFHDAVRQYGGYAGFATSPSDVARITRRIT